MAYEEPGVTQQEQLSPTNLATSPLSATLALVGIAPRERTVFNEALRRGQVVNEALTFTPSSPYLATLATRANRRQQDAVLLRNGTDVIPISGWSFLPAQITSLPETYAIPANAYITLSIDKRGYISIPIPPAALQTAANIAIAINNALNGSPLYGPGYAGVAVDVAGTVQLTSPTSGPNSDIRVIPTPDDTAPVVVDVTTTIFGVVIPFIAQTIIQIADPFYQPSSTYTLSYISVSTIVDPLLNPNVQAITKIGNLPNVTDYISPTDYDLSGNNIDWAANTQVTLSAVGLEPYAIVAGVNDQLRFSINGLSVKTVTFPAGPQAAADLATIINQALIVDPVYGPLYGAVAADDGLGRLTLTAPNQFLDEPAAQGAYSMIEFFATPANSVTLLFGIANSSLPYMKTGESKQPAVGATYFATYTFTRLNTDYNNSSAITNLFLNEDDAHSYTGPITSANVSQNKLGIGASIAFDNGAPRVVLIQADDSTSPGFPTVNQMNRAIDAAADNSEITDIVVLDTRLAVHVRLLEHVATASSPSEKDYRMGWYGMARNTPVGSVDVPDTLVYRAKVTLQVSPDSPGRGRSILVAPSNVSRQITYADGSEALVALDGTFLAVSVAARKTSFLNPATALVRKTITGFDIDSFQTYLKGERKTLLSNGVTVVSPIGGRFVIVDALTTEQGAGNVIEFIEPSAMAQKDAVVRAVDQALEDNVVGIVPTDLADYINDIKGFIAGALQSLIDNGYCGRYTDQNGNPRNINLSSDIQVFRSKTDPRKYFFRYWFNLRYPGKIFDGVYAVDAPFNPQNTVQTALPTVFVIG